MLSMDERQNIISKMEEDVTWRNTNFTLFEYIQTKYDKNDLLNNYGDIFYKVKYISGPFNNSTYICKRVLWSLGLSSEYYLVREFAEFDSDDSFDHWEYEVECLNEEKVKRYLEGVGGNYVND